jgi:hypothetical protein
VDLVEVAAAAVELQPLLDKQLMGELGLVGKALLAATAIM